MEQHRGGRSHDFIFDWVGKESNNEKEGDVANHRSGDGLSSPTYMICMVRNKLDPTDELQPNIVYCGKRNTTRCHRFLQPGVLLVDICGKPVGLQGCMGLKDFNQEFQSIHDIFKVMVERNPERSVEIFTELRKDEVLYRCDPLSPFQNTADQKFMSEGWRDWALFLYEVEEGPVHTAGSNRKKQQKNPW